MEGGIGILFVVIFLLFFSKKIANYFYADFKVVHAVVSVVCAIILASWMSHDTFVVVGMAAFLFFVIYLGGLEIAELDNKN